MYASGNAPNTIRFGSVLRLDIRPRLDVDPDKESVVRRIRARVIPQLRLHRVAHLLQQMGMVLLEVTVITYKLV